MDIPLETLVLITIVIAAAAVALLELRYIRGRKKVKVDAAIERDDAYNAVSTTRAVAESLRQNGRDTTEADVLIYKAESAYDRREFLNAIELAGRARKVLMTCKERDLTSMPAPAPKKGESDEVPADHVRKLPANYLESKFMIDSVRDMLPDAGDGPRAEASICLGKADDCFAREDYCGALGEAMKAKRCLMPTAAAGAKSYPSTVVKLGPAGKAPPVSEGAFSDRTCPSCRAKAMTEDAYCRKCGTRLNEQ